MRRIITMILVLISFGAFGQIHPNQIGHAADSNSVLTSKYLWNGNYYGIWTHKDSLGLGGGGDLDWLKSDGTAPTDSLDDIHTYGSITARNPNTLNDYFAIDTANFFWGENITGFGEHVRDTGIIAIGNEITFNTSASWYNSNTIAIGNGITQTGIRNWSGIYVGQGISIGDWSWNSVGVGQGIELDGYYSTAIAALAKAKCTNCTAIGYAASALNYAGNFALGASSRSWGDGSLTFGSSSQGTGIKSLILGHSSTNYSNYSSLVGFNNTCTQYNHYVNMFGYKNKAGTSSKLGSLLLGNYLESKHSYAFMIGSGHIDIARMETFADTSFSVGWFGNYVLNVIHSDSSGGYSRVGINTTYPTKELDINGELRIRTVDTTSTALEVLVIDEEGIVKKSDNVGTDDQIIDTLLIEDGDLVISLEDDGVPAERVSLSALDDGDWTISGVNMYSQPAGNVGIGLTSPGAKLHVEGPADGALNSDDAIFGDDGGYGGIRVGDGQIQFSSYKTGALDFDGAMFFRNRGTPQGTYEFIWTESNNSVRFAIPKSGSGLGTYNPRSFIIAGPAPADDDMVLGSYWGFDKVDMNTSVTGADLGVQDDLQVLGSSWLEDGVIMEEQSNHPQSIDPGFGQYWVKDDAPNKPYFTDDAGNDYDLTATGTDDQKVTWLQLMGDTLFTIGLEDDGDPVYELDLSPLRDDGDWITSGSFMYSDSTKYIGIGTSTPADKFHVYANGDGIRLDAGIGEINIGDLSDYFWGHGFKYDPADEKLGLYNYEESKWSYSFNGSSHHFEDGSVGIGIVPTAKLDVSGAARIRAMDLDNSLTKLVADDGTGVLHTMNIDSLPYLATVATDSTIFGSGIPGDPLSVDFGETPDDGDWTVSGSDIYNSNTGIVEVKNELYVGTDEGSADARIQLGKDRTLDGNAYFDLIAEGSGGSYAYGLRAIRLAGTDGNSQFTHRGNGDLIFNANEASADISFKQGGSERIFIENGGEVGIGTTTPTRKLDVNGVARIRTISTDNSLSDLLVKDTDGTVKSREVVSLPFFSGNYTDLDFTGTTGLADSADDQQLTLVGHQLSIEDGNSVTLPTSNVTTADMSFLRLTSDSTQNINASASDNLISWNVQQEHSYTSVFSHSVSTNNSRVEVLEDGNYHFTGELVYNVESAVAERYAGSLKFKINGTTTLTERFQANYVRDANGHDENGIHFSIVIPLEANDYVEILIDRMTTVTTAANISADESTLNVILLKSAISTASGDNWGSQAVVTSGSALSGDGTSATPLTVNVDDADASTTNEAWTIDADFGTTEVISNQTLLIGGSGIVSTSYSSGSPDKLTISATETDPVYSADPASTITNTDITNWNTDLVDDADADPTNELQDLSWNNTTNTIEITDGTNAVITGFLETEVDGSVTNEAWTVTADDLNNELITTQTVDFAGGTDISTTYSTGSNTVTINNDMTWTSLPGKPAGFADNIDNVDDADSDPTNEAWYVETDLSTPVLVDDDVIDFTGGTDIQTSWSPTNKEVIISYTGSSSEDHDFYEIGTTSAPNSINDNIYTEGDVTIGDNANAGGYRLNVVDNTAANTMRLRQDNASYDNTIYFDRLSQTDWTLGSTSTGKFHLSLFSSLLTGNILTLDDGYTVGVNEEAPEGILHVNTTSSNSQPQLQLEDRVNSTNNTVELEMLAESDIDDANVHNIDLEVISDDIPAYPSGTQTLQYDLARIRTYRPDDDRTDGEFSIEVGLQHDSIQTQPYWGEGGERFRILSDGHVKLTGYGGDGASLKEEEAQDYDMQMDGLGVIHRTYPGVMPIRTVSTTSQAQYTDHTFICTNASNIDIDLYSDSFLKGKEYRIKRAGAGDVRLDPASGTIDGSATYTLDSSNPDPVTIIFDGTNYHIVGN